MTSLENEIRSCTCYSNYSRLFVYLSFVGVVAWSTTNEAQQRKGVIYCNGHGKKYVIVFVMVKETLPVCLL